MSKNVVDIVLPCFNPIESWAENVVEQFEILEEADKGNLYRLILVNDGSTNGVSDKDIDYLKKQIKFFKYISYKENKGKGYALRMGVAESSGDIILLTDIDFPYTVESMTGMIKEVNKGDSDIVAGERNNIYYKKVPVFRKILSKALKKVVKSFLKIKVSDTQCGLKAFTKDAKHIFLQTTINRYLFDIEFLWLAGKTLDIKAYPVLLKDDVVFTKMNMKIILGESYNFLKLLVVSSRM